MNIGSNEILAVWAVCSMAGSMLFWGTFHLGRLMTRVERVELRTEDAHKRMDNAGDEMSDLTDKVQRLMYGRGKE